MMNENQENILNGYDEQYTKCIPNYNKLRESLVQALEIILNEHKVKFLQIQHRTKEKESFLKKVNRKNYDYPFEQIEDICGIRIICYYQSDVDKIAEIIENEFDSQPKETKEENLGADQFGYRSTHFIIKIKDNWKGTPNYRGVESLKAEIQIRTVLMHAWAEIEHKLAYKNEKQIPSKFKRDFAGISALLEIADKEFERLKDNIANYQGEVTKSLTKNEYDKIELNIVSLQTFLDNHFQNFSKDKFLTADLLVELINLNISLKEYSEYYEILETLFPEIINDFANTFGDTPNQHDLGLIILDIFKDAYSRDLNMCYENYPEFIEKYKKIILQ